MASKSDSHTIIENLTNGQVKMTMSVSEGVVIGIAVELPNVPLKQIDFATIQTVYNSMKSIATTNAYTWSQ